MNGRSLPFLVLTLGVLSGAGCGALEPAGGGESASRSVRVEHGYVQSIEVFRHGDNQPVNVGLLLGGLAGGVVGHQIGGGQGKTIATIGGAIAGAVVGNEVEKSRVEGARYRVSVHLDSGATLTLENSSEMNLRVGDRVRVENNKVMRD
jgi:outer membrane lipoprotein SlyB